MGDQPHTLAVLFADICDSTRLYHELGDAVAHSLAKQCLELISESTVRSGGTLVKTIGDGAMCTFPDARTALNAAVAIVDGSFGSRVRLRVGLHIGAVIVTENDVFGDTVNVAARVLARSGPGEILMSGAIVRELRPEQRDAVRLLDTTPVKGRPEALEIYSYISDRTNVTIIVPSSTKRDGGALVLTLGSQELRLERTAGPLLIGRDAGCGLVIPSELVSRRHATIDVQRSTYVLTDHSSNGTFVTADYGATPRFIRREPVHLDGSGTISFGAAPENNPNVVRYRPGTSRVV
jgi:class 3 adenylate cyclase